MYKHYKRIKLYLSILLLRIRTMRTEINYILHKKKESTEREMTNPTIC